MIATILHGNRAATAPDALAEGETLWLTPDDLARATDWEWTPEGFCRGPMCVPVPPGASWLRETDGETRISLDGLARHLGQPVAASAAHRVWAVGESHQDLADRLRSLEAPDFTLPDLDGRPHALSDSRGRKVFLLAWASW